MLRENHLKHSQRRRELWNTSNQAWCSKDISVAKVTLGALDTCVHASLSHETFHGPKGNLLVRRDSLQHRRMPTLEIHLWARDYIWKADSQEWRHILSLAQQLAACIWSWPFRLAMWFSPKYWQVLAGGAIDSWNPWIDSEKSIMHHYGILEPARKLGEFH